MIWFDHLILTLFFLIYAPHLSSHTFTLIADDTNGK